MARERWFRAIALAVGVLAGALLGELGLRIQTAVSGHSLADADVRRTRTLLPPPYDGSCEGKLGASVGALVWPSAHRGVVYELKPGLDTCFVRVRVRTTADGLRTGADGPPAASSAPFRILLLGDSQAFGWGVTHEDSVGAVLEREARAAGRSVQVLNAAVPGYNAAQQAAYLAAVGTRFDPDCVLVLFTGNDLDPPIFRASAEKPRRPRSYVAAAVRRAWRRWRAPSAAEGQPLEALAFGPSPPAMEEIPEEYRAMVGVDGYRQALASMAQSADRLDVPLVNFADYSHVMTEGEARDVVEYQRSLGILHPDFRYPNAGRLRLGADDPHLNALGHQALARRMAAALRTLDVCPP